MIHTRESDEKLLIQFAKNQGFDHTDLMEAVERLEKCLKDGLQNYRTTELRDDRG